MAALPDRYMESLVDLRDLTPEHLAPLLEEETEAWRIGMDWDFRPSAELVRRFVNLRALNGWALVSGGSVIGYSYYVAEEGKGLIGDFFVRPAARTEEAEGRLLEAVLQSMWRTPGTRRIEAQLLMLTSPLGRGVPYARWFHSYPRRFMEAPLALAPSLPAREPAGTAFARAVAPSLPAREPAGTAFAPWTESWQDQAARLIADTYRGHPDSQINDQYRSQTGARRFLTNIVQYPGCGSFFGPASFVAWNRAERSMCGLSLASLVASGVGHITQICTAPSHQGKGIGYELLRRSLTALAAHGCRSVSLTVTSANESAVRFYEQMGFHTRREFAACVWEMR